MRQGNTCAGATHAPGQQGRLAAALTENRPVTNAIQARAFDTVPSVPLGQFRIRTAYRRNLVGRVEDYGVFLWNIRRV
jgi:peptide/nickel transport system substrate-binding protein